MSSFARNDGSFVSILKVILYTIGYLVIITIPVCFFLFGWKGVELSCQREKVGQNPSCKIVESFGIGLYSRSKVVQNVLQIAYQSDVIVQSSTNIGMISKVTSTLVFSTPEGDVQITHSVDKASEKELIQKTREFLQSPETLEFQGKASLRSIFGWIGFFGTSVILLVLLEVIRYNFLRSRPR